MFLACQSRVARHCLALRSCATVIPLARAIAVAVARPTWLTYARTVSHVMVECPARLAL